MHPEHDVPSTPVTVENWRSPERIGWSFQHMDDIFPTAVISRGGGPVVGLPADPVDLTGLQVPLQDGTTMTVPEVVEASDTDGWLVMHCGRVVAEEYMSPLTPATRHLLMSVSKSLVSTVTGALVDRGLIVPEALVSDYLPELADSGYAGATVRHLLDMRSGVRFSEDYLDPGAEVSLLDVSAGWAPGGTGTPRTLKAFLATLRQERPHGGPFRYRSADTDVLGWVCEAAGGRPFAHLASELLWSRLGAEHDAFISVDAEGTGIFDGGVCATLGDLARFGAAILAGGLSLTGERVVSPAWVEDIFTGGADSAEAFAAGPDAHGMPGGRYRNKFWFPRAGGDVALCLGIHGQFVYIDRARDVVGVKLSSWPDPVDEWKHHATMRMFDTIATHVAGMSRTAAGE
ncbi:serine hydrolase [Streptomyces sp. AC627_RSS907]|uniref:serine hydrolase domain-containing protein n=1 Tax=Streptomyces sp. AC627_RSS907 TaxID=2823684 RepID=UPI001C24334C|nr:serine hydrolase [Streptomyces sp. AC627_RSS907]